MSTPSSAVSSALSAATTNAASDTSATSDGFINVATIVAQLMIAPSQTLTNMQTQQTSEQTQLSDYGTLQNLMTNVQTDLTSLQVLSTQQAYSATSSDPTSVTATAEGSAAIGSHTVSVTQLATANQLASTAFAGSGDPSIGTTGSFTVNSGSNSFSVNITSSNNTVQGVADAINNASGNTSVTASVLTSLDSHGNPQSTLLLSANNTGAANAITLTDNTGNVAATLATTQLQPAQDALFKVDGYNEDSASNSVSNVLTGINFNLLNTTGSTTINVAKDATTTDQNITTAIQTFVTDYNTLISKMNTFQQGDTANTFTIPGIASAMNNVLESVTTGLGTYSSLSQIGITTAAATTSTNSNGVQQTSSGELTLDTNALQTALNTDPASVMSLFGDATQGIATNLFSTMNNMLSTGGVVSDATSDLNTQLTTIGDQITEEQSYLTNLQDQYIQEYSSLNSTLSQFQTTSNYITQAFSSLPTTSSRSVL